MLQQIVTVAKFGGDWKSIDDGLLYAASIASTVPGGPRIVVLVAPGIWDEPINMGYEHLGNGAINVDLVSMCGWRNTIIQQKAVSGLNGAPPDYAFLFYRNTGNLSVDLPMSLKGFTFRLYGGTIAYPIAVTNYFTSINIEDCRVIVESNALPDYSEKGHAIDFGGWGGRVRNTIMYGNQLIVGVLGVHQPGTVIEVEHNDIVCGSEYDAHIYNYSNGGIIKSRFNYLHGAARPYLVDHPSTILCEHDSYGECLSPILLNNDVGDGAFFADLTGGRTYLCSADVPVGAPVYVSGNSTVSKASNDDAAKMPAIGMVVYKPTETTAIVKNTGSYWKWFEGSPLFPANTIFYVGIDGGITSTVPQGIVQVIGIGAGQMDEAHELILREG